MHCGNLANMPNPHITLSTAPLILSISGAYIYDGCGTPEVAAAAAADYISRRTVGVESCDNPPQYWPGKHCLMVKV